MPLLLARNARLVLPLLTAVTTLAAAQRSPVPDTSKVTVIVPGAVWDGVADSPQRGWVVLLRGEMIETVGPVDRVVVPGDAARIALPGTTLIPGLIEGHSHLFLHPYDETLWDDQVLREPLGFRMAEAVAHARATLEAGITTERDLGTEGAWNYDVQLKQAIERGVVPGPRLIVVTRAIVATGSYGPRRRDYSFEPPQGAEEASGPEAIARVVRSQIGHGADWVKVYADYRWGPNGEALPDLFRGRAAGTGGDGEGGRPAGGGACDYRRGNAAGDTGGGRDGRARRRRHCLRYSGSCDRKAWRSVPPSPPRRPMPSTSTAG